MVVKVIGVGGIGCCLVPVLARFLNFSHPNSTLVLIDGDSFEARNQDRQLAEPYSPKAQSVADRLMKEGFASLTILARSVYVTDENVDGHVECGDVVLMAVDNHGTRKVLSEYAENTLRDVVIVSGSNDLTDGIVQVFVKKGGTNHTLPLGNDFHPEIRDADVAEATGAGCDERQQQVPQLLITNNAVAALMLSVFYGTLNGPLNYDEVYIDIATGNSRAVRRRPND